ncbi:MAG: TolC family protein [Bacteroidaceae bacterium]|nr:TolC family protein [Bacteroidaceae bacterium]
MKHINNICKGIVLLSVAALCSCAQLKQYVKNAKMKDYTRPADVVTDKLYGTMAAEIDSTTMAKFSWRELYKDPCLQALIEKALSANHDLKYQEWAVAQAESSLKESKKAILPSIWFNPGGGYSYMTGGVGSQWSYSIPLSLEWEVNFFKKFSNHRKMSAANVEMEKEYINAVKGRIVANIASLYYQLQAYDQTLKLADEALAMWAEMIEASEALMEAGVSDAVAVSQFKAKSYEYVTLKQVTEHGIKQAEAELCLLMCETPHAIQRSKDVVLLPADMVSAGISAQLLDNRPDVRAAERQLEAFYYNEAYARSQFYPSITFNLQALFNGEFLASAMGSIVAPLFSQYKLKAAQEIALAQYEQQKGVFQHTLETAGKEVVLALQQYKTAGDKFATHKEQIDEYKNAVVYSREQMYNGDGTYLSVLTAQSELYAKLQTLIDDTFEQQQSIISLYLALGGGAK